jgi:hypothetical protein
MRCQKCGYITFDNYETCPSCNKQMVKEGQVILGNVFNIESPRFLKFDAEEETPEPRSVGAVSGEIDFSEDFEFTDETDMEFDSDSFSETAGGGALGADFDDLETFGEDSQDAAEGELVDFGEFEEEADTLFAEQTQPVYDEEQEQELEPAPALDIPDELADISDLSPPSDDASDLAADDIGTNLFYDDETDELDDIDLDSFKFEIDGEQHEEEEDIEDDLEFDFDLGGLSIHEDRKK